ncbi:MAG: hypothetical protein H0T53_15140 [Herpetosiphonaceae bacterium]|nr:hypothetical protein [Herpetosiphonaceae bacterium]
MSALDDELAQGIAAAKLGQRDVARQHLQNVLRTDPRHETAWLWMSGLVDTPAQKRDCLQRVLALNPGNEMARRGMEQMAQSEAASFLSVFEPRTPPPAPVVIAPPPLSETPEAVIISEPLPIGIADVPQPSQLPAGAAPSAAPALDLPPPSKITDAPCVFCGAPTGMDGICDTCGIEQIFDCPLCSHPLDLRERKVCECGQSMLPFLVSGGVDHNKLGDEYQKRDYPGAAVKQWKAALATSPKPSQLHRKIAEVYLDLGMIEQSRQHNELSKQK